MRKKAGLQNCIVVWAVLCLALPSFAWAAQKPAAVAYVLALTDFHGRLEERGADVGLPKLMTAVKDFTTQYPATVLVGVGDLFTGSVESDLLQGRPVLEGLLAAGLSLSALGNHEFDGDRGDIARWSKAGLPFVCANVRVDKEAKGGTAKPGAVTAPEGVAPFALREVGGITIAFVGLLTTKTPRIVKQGNTEGLAFLSPLEVLPSTVKTARKAGAEAVIVLAHLAKDTRPEWRQGIDPDLRALAKVPGVTAVVYGHSHEEHSGDERGSAGETVPVLQPLPYGRGLAVLRLERDGQGQLRATGTLDKLVQRKASLKEDPAGKAIVRQARADVGPEMEKVVGRVSVPLPQDNTAPSLLGELVCDAVRQQTGAEVALVNGGALRGSLDSGPVLLRDLYRILPFNNTLRVMTLTGAELRQVLERSLNNRSARCIQLSGVRAHYNAALPKGQRVSLHRADGSVVNAEDKLRVATNAFLAKGGEGVFLPGMGTKRHYVKMTERDAFRLLLQKTELTAPVFQGWLTLHDVKQMHPSAETPKK